MKSSYCIPKKTAVIISTLLFIITAAFLIVFLSNGANKRQVYQTKAAPHAIVGGKPTKQKWPFMVFLFTYDGLKTSKTKDNNGKISTKYNLDEQFACGATLISNTWALTAAHCVDAYIPKEIGIAIGYNNLDDVFDTNHGLYHIKKIILHPSYNWIYHDNDLALLLIDGPIRENFETISLNDKGIREILFTPSLLLGWGKTENGYIQSLNEVYIPLLSNALVNKPDWLNGDVAQSMIAAGFPLGGQGQCMADSGGPMLMWDSNEDRWYQIGVISWSYKTKGRCALPYKPSVSQRVSSFMDWIYQETWIDPGLGSFKGTPPEPPESYEERMKEFNSIFEEQRNKYQEN